MFFAVDTWIFNCDAHDDSKIMEKKALTSQSFLAIIFWHQCPKPLPPAPQCFEEVPRWKASLKALQAFTRIYKKGLSLFQLGNLPWLRGRCIIQCSDCDERGLVWTCLLHLEMSLLAWQGWALGSPTKFCLTIVSCACWPAPWPHSMPHRLGMFMSIADHCSQFHTVTLFDCPLQTMRVELASYTQNSFVFVWWGLPPLQIQAWIFRSDMHLGRLLRLAPGRLLRRRKRGPRPLQLLLMRVSRICFTTDMSCECKCHWLFGYQEISFPF